MRVRGILSNLVGIIKRGYTKILSFFVIKMRETQALFEIIVRFVLVVRIG